MEPPIECFEVSRPLSTPLIEFLNEKGWIQSGEPKATGVSIDWRRNVKMRAQPLSDLVEESFDKRPELTVRSGPLAPSVCRDSLIEMSERHIEAITLQEPVNLIVGLRDVKGLRKRRAKLAFLDRIPV